VEIMDDDTRLKENLELQARVAKLEGQAKHSLLDLESDTGKISLGSIGGGMMLAGTLAIAGWRRKK
jgi:hydroxylamine dehydrogenase